MRLLRFGRCWQKTPSTNRLNSFPGPWQDFTQTGFLSNKHKLWWHESQVESCVVAYPTPIVTTSVGIGMHRRCPACGRIMKPSAAPVLTPFYFHIPIQHSVFPAGCHDMGVQAQYFKKFSQKIKQDSNIMLHYFIDATKSATRKKKIKLNYYIKVDG